MCFEARDQLKFPFETGIFPCTETRPSHIYYKAKRKGRGSLLLKWCRLMNLPGGEIGGHEEDRKKLDPGCYRLVPC